MTKRGVDKALADEAKVLLAIEVEEVKKAITEQVIYAGPPERLIELILEIEHLDQEEPELRRQEAIYFIEYEIKREISETSWNRTLQTAKWLYNQLGDCFPIMHQYAKMSCFLFYSDLLSDDETTVLDIFASLKPSEIDDMFSDMEVQHVAKFKDILFRNALIADKGTYVVVVASHYRKLRLNVFEGRWLGDVLNTISKELKDSETPAFVAQETLTQVAAISKEDTHCIELDKPNFYTLSTFIENAMAHDGAQVRVDIRRIG